MSRPRASSTNGVASWSANRDRLSATARGADRRRLGRGPAGAAGRAARRRTRRTGTLGMEATSRRPRRTRRRDGRTPAGRRRLRDPSQGRRSGGKAVWGTVHPGQRVAREADRRAGRTDRRARALALQRESSATTTLAVKAEADGEQARRATGLVAELGGELAAARRTPSPPRWTMRCAAPSRWASRYDEVAEALREVTAQLKVYGTEGRKGQLDAAETEREHAEAEYLRVHRPRPGRAVAALGDGASPRRHPAALCRPVPQPGGAAGPHRVRRQLRSRDRQRTADLQPHTVGPHRSVRVVVGRREGATGHRRRLAGAALVAKEDSVPVVIDDALGFTDADRLTKMGAVFDAVGGDGQVIVLTCSPQRYAGVGGAHHIDGGVEGSRSRTPDRGGPNPAEGDLTRLLALFVRRSIGGRMNGDDTERQASSGARQAGRVAGRASGAPAGLTRRRREFDLYYVAPAASRHIRWSSSPAGPGWRRCSSIAGCGVGPRSRGSTSS